MINEYMLGAKYIDKDEQWKCDVHWKGRSNSKFVYDPRMPMPKAAEIKMEIAEAIIHAQTMFAMRTNKEPTILEIGRHTLDCLRNELPFHHFEIIPPFYPGKIFAVWPTVFGLKINLTDKSEGFMVH